MVGDWEDLGWFRRVVGVISAPLHFVCALTVPIMEHIASEEERRTGYFSWWSRHLLALNLLVDPLFISWAVGGASTVWGDTEGGGPTFPAWALCLMVGAVASVVCLALTSDDRPPRYYQVLAPLSFLTSVFWIYFFAGELVSLIEVIGLVFGISETLLGLTVLAWGNSIGDLISNTTMARLGFANMGVSACFGSPLLSTFLYFYFYFYFYFYLFFF